MTAAGEILYDSYGCEVVAVRWIDVTSGVADDEGSLCCDRACEDGKER